ncbi:hypothetical protein MKX03_016161 [Papaver bracteatum]|nr:hypothetical protein MKX03_016161 [Papaver bracteatum]
MPLLIHILTRTCSFWINWFANVFFFKTSKRIGTVKNLAAKKKQELAEQVKDIFKNFKESDKYH